MNKFFSEPNDAPAGGRDKLAAIAGGEPAGERVQKMPAGRRGARATAVQALFEADVTGRPVKGLVDRLAAESRMSDQHKAFAAELATEVESRRPDYDAMINKVAREYPAGRMAVIDRNILRAALAELKRYPDTPRAIVIDEAVELARLFGSDGSRGLVHGTLGALLG